MRLLTLDESISKVQEKAIEVEFCDKIFYLDKINLFWNFLESQPRLNGILTSVEKTHLSIGEQLTALNKNTTQNRQAEKLFFSLDTEEKRGAFGYYIIKNIRSNGNWTIPYDTIRSIFHLTSNYEESKEKFNELIFKPFVNHIIELLEESRTDEIKDYFSKAEARDTEDRIDKIIEELEKLSLGNEVLFEELQDLKQQLNVLNKKNWLQLVKGKLIDLTIEGVAKEALNIVYKSITGQDFYLLE